MAERSLQQLLITNFALGPSGYTGSRGDLGYTGSAGTGGGSAGPTIATIGYVGNNTATDVAGGETISLTGTGFATGCSVIINGSPVGAVTFISATQVTFVAPALSAGTYILYLVNTNGSTAISVPGISYSGVPSFYVGAGSVGTVYEASSFNSNVAAVGDSAITYTIASGLLPGGATLNANGVITGTSVLTGNATTYTFGVNASDGQNQDVTRTYTITVNPDSVAWSSPASGSTISIGQNSASSTTLTAVSAAGKAITYSANALPTGLSISGNVVTGTPTVLGNTTSILTANATSTTRTATITVVWNIAVLGDPYFMYNSLLLSGNGTNNATNNTFLDSSTNNFAFTRAGNTTQGTFSPYGENWSNYLGGAGNYFQTPASSASTIVGTLSSTANLTIECWIYPTAYNSSANFPGLIGDMVATSENNNWSWGITNTGTLMIYWNSGTQLRATSSNAVPLNTWTHIALNVAAGAITMYINGVSQSLSGTTTLSTPGSNGYLVIGQWNNGSGGTNGTSHGLYTGYISNLRVVKSSTYTSSFTPSTTPLTAISNTSLLYCQSNRFKDNSTNNLAITLGGSPTVQRFSPFRPTAAYSASTTGGSGYFDGNGDSLTSTSAGIPPALTFLNGASGTGTIECWAYVNSVPAQGSFVYSFPPIIALGSTYFSMGVTAANKFRFYWWIGSATSFDSTIDVNLGCWNHLVAVRNGGTIYLYVNGQPAGSTAMTGIAWASAADGTNLYIGYTNPGSGLFLNGYVSNLRVVNGTAVYTSSFTPPTSPVTAITNTALLLNFTNAGIIDSTMINNLETVGDAKISTTQSKFGGGSMYFDGNEDHLSTYNPSYSLSVGSGDFTFECWLYLNSLPSFAAAVYHLKNDAALATTVFDLEITPAGAISVSTGTALIATGTSGKVTTGNWIHFAFVRTSGVFKTFFNGIQDISISNTTTYNGTYLQIGAFRYSSYYSSLNGYLDDLRITKGYARYTANFTPPSTALGTQ